MSVSLTAYWQQFINQRIESGRYNNQSEVIRAGLRALEDLERTSEVREFERVFADGLPGEPGQKVIQSVIARQKTHNLF